MSRKDRSTEPYRKLMATKLPENLDRRIRVQKSEYEIIKSKYKDGQSIHSLARDYAVNKRLIQFILFPERLEHHKMLQKKRRLDGRYKPSKEKWALTMREHRAYKKSVLKK